MNLDPSHGCSLGPRERGQKQGSSGPHYLSPLTSDAAPTMGNTQERPSETIDRERKRLVETLQADSGLLLDALLARGVLTGPEYEALDALPDAERRVRRLLLLVQSKGEAAPGEHVITTETVRSFRAPDSPLVLGMQGNVWTEHISTPERLFYMAFPRAEALSEICRRKK